MEQGVHANLPIGNSSVEQEAMRGLRVCGCGENLQKTDMFETIRSFLEKRRIRRDLETFMNPAAVEAAIKAGGPTPAFTPGRIEYVVVFIQGNDPGLVSSRIANVTSIVAESGAVVMGVIGALVVAASGVPPSPDPIPGARANLVSALHKQLPACLKIVHGAAEGHHGLFGGGTMFAHTFLVPQFDAILGALSRMEFGRSEEVIRR